MPDNYIKIDKRRIYPGLSCIDNVVSWYHSIIVLSNRLYLKWWYSHKMGQNNITIISTGFLIFS